MPKQVNKEHYFSDDYLNKDRFLALREQLIACLETNGKSFLEIGPGPNLLTPLLKQFNKTTTTLDMAYELKPDIVGDLLTFLVHRIHLMLYMRSSTRTHSF